MSAGERREELLELLRCRRHDTYDNLAFELRVSKMTIRRDIAVLMCSYPIVTVHGGRHGCVKVMDGYQLQYRKFTSKQVSLLRKLRSQLANDDLDTMNTILARFAP